MYPAITSKCVIVTTPRKVAESRVFSGPYFPTFGIRILNTYSVEMWKNTDQKNSTLGHFSRSVRFHKKLTFCLYFRPQPFIMDRGPYETKYSRMDQVKFVEDSLRKILSDVVCLGRPYHFRFFKGCLPKILLGPFLNTWSHMTHFEQWTKFLTFWFKFIKFCRILITDVDKEILVLM